MIISGYPQGKYKKGVSGYIMKRILLTALCALALCSPSASADNDITIRLNGSRLLTEQPPFVENGRTLVPLKAVCQSMGLQVIWHDDTREISISYKGNEVSLCIDNDIININGIDGKLDAPPKIIDGVSWIPIRAVVEPFGATVGWDSEKRIVIIDYNRTQVPASKPVTDNTDTAPPVSSEDIIGGNSSTNTPPAADEKPTVPSVTDKEETPDDSILEEPTPDKDEELEEAETENKGFTFYAQAGEEWGLENSGRGYCWVCSYAMLITDITKKAVLPSDIAEFNLNNGSDSGNYMANHLNLAKEYGLKFVPAIDEDSPYFERFDSSHRGATYFKTESDEDVKNALIEALERNPNGIMVRFEGYPHTLIATHTADGEVYYNDPGKLDTENVTFENTVLAKRFTLSDLSYVQAMEIK